MIGRAQWNDLVTMFHVLAGKEACFGMNSRAAGANIANVSHEFDGLCQPQTKATGHLILQSGTHRIQPIIGNMIMLIPNFDHVDTTVGQSVFMLFRQCCDVACDVESIIHQCFRTALQQKLSCSHFGADQVSTDPVIANVLYT